MFKKLSLNQKMIGLVAAVLIVTSVLSFWITDVRVNRQADAAFIDKVRQITGMASATRDWYSAKIDKLVPGRDFKNIEQVPVVVAWSVAQQYAQSAGMEFRTPSLTPRNPKNQADDFERRALGKFQADPSLKEYTERVTEGGRDWMRYAQAVRLSTDCLLCHGDPAGTKDAFGYTKEGMKEGDLRGAFEVKAPVDELVANASSNSRMLFLTSFLTLLAAAGAVAMIVRSMVIGPVAGVQRLLASVAGGDLRGRMKVQNEDEVGRMSEALNSTIENVSAALQRIDDESRGLSTASEHLSTVSQQISANSEETSAQATVVSAATEEVNRNLVSVATATEEMCASMAEIAKNATQSAKVAGDAMNTATETNSIVAKLGASSAEIGQVIKVITSIAQKTDLLALNATVEAARAGEVGAGFAVVANEVKELAKQTANATEDISRRIEAIQSDAKSAVKAIGSIGGIIREVNDISGSIAAAVEQQSATAGEMSRSLSEAAKGAEDVGRNIQGVAQAAESTAEGATDSMKAAQQLAALSQKLRALVDQFKLQKNGAARN